MTQNRYRREILLELSLLDHVAQQIESLGKDAEEGRFGERDTLAAVTVMMNLYNGIENIFKRTCRFRGIPLPAGGETHRELLSLFSESDSFSSALPVLVPPHMQRSMNQLRKFRHVIMHGYAFTLEKERIMIALQEAPALYAAFKKEVERFLAELPSEEN
jgi:hypothetical protein